jgi:signal transduction histidine kinase/tetratricopeptide (TPR) repeat protein
MGFRLNWQRRSTVILAGVTLVIGFILIMLAVREAEREKLAQERDLEGEQQRYATLFKEEIGSLFSEVEKEITSALADSEKQWDLQNLSNICRLKAANDDLIGDIFLADSNGELVFPLKNPLYLASERRRLAAKNLEKIEGTRFFRRAESAELAVKNLPLAIESYKALLDSVPDDSSKAIVLNRLARCYLKAGNLNQALNTYYTILDKHPDELSSEGIPLGIISFFQIGTIHLKTEQEKAGQTMLEFYSRLVSSEWPLDKAQFQFYRDIIKKMGETWKSKSKAADENRDFQNRWDELEKQADAKLQILAANEDLIEKIVPLVQARLLEFDSERQEFSRFSEIIGNTLFLITAATVQKDIVLGIRIDNAVLIQDCLPMIQDRIPVPEDWLVQIVDSAGRVISGEEALSSGKADPGSAFVLGFEQDFPPWQIRIFQKFPQSVERQYNLRRNVYILIVGVVMAVLFLGGFMAIRSTAKMVELARLKSEFVATVSHEFRTPLMSIRYLSEMLDGGRVKGEAKKKIYFGKIKKESERLSRLIENMLDFSKIEAGMKEYKFEGVSVKELIEEISTRFKQYMADKKMTLDCEIQDDLPAVRADREAISRALFNLLDNAVKYSGKNPVIHLRAFCDGEAVFLEVQDKGAGIGKDDQKKVFEKFYRSSHPVSKSIEGSGIGLTLVEHIVKAHGGQVRIESDLGQGTTVTIELPVLRKGKHDGKQND